jgi:3-oxoacyl-[acyl-carrier protein] reductase
VSRWRDPPARVKLALRRMDLVEEEYVEPSKAQARDGSSLPRPAGREEGAAPGKVAPGRVALVTGVSRRVGIGAAIAHELARAGAKLFLSFHRAYDEAQPWTVEADEPERIAEGLRDLGAEVGALEIDLSAQASPRTLFDAATLRFGAVDILIHNATCSEQGDIRELDADQLDRHYAVNMRAPMLLSGELARRRPSGEGGRIIIITSGQGHSPMPGEVAYIATKGGMEALTLSLAQDLARQGITVNAVDPGATDTGWMSPELKASLEAASPKGRVGRPEDAARLVRFLASEEAGWVTGQVIRSRGGP